MKVVIFITLCCVAITTCAAQTYTDRWDNINLDEILQSDRLLKAYVDCLMDRGKCTPDAKTLKDTIPDALENECVKCTKKQKEGSDKVIKFLVNDRPAVWKELATKYDPENKYQARYKDVVKERGIQL